MRYIQHMTLAACTGLFAADSLVEYVAGASDASERVKHRCAQVLRKQGWKCTYSIGEDIHARKRVNGRTRTLRVEVAPLPEYDITVTRDGGLTPLTFASVDELAAWLPEFLDEPASKQSGGDDSSTGDEPPPIDTGDSFGGGDLSLPPPTPAPAAPEPEPDTPPAV